MALVVVAAASALSALDLFVVNLAFSSIRDRFAGATNQSLSRVLNVQRDHALAPDVELLIVARALEGVSAALMIPTSLGLLLAAYPRERHKQMVSVWGATGGSRPRSAPSSAGCSWGFTARQIGGAFGVAILVALSGPASSAGDFRGVRVAIASFGLVSACAALALTLREKSALGSSLEGPRARPASGTDGPA